MLAVATLLVLMAGTTRAIAGGAMELARLEPRWVTVQVVTTIPGDRELRLSEPAIAWYQADPGSRRRTVTVPGSQVERVFFANRSPVDHSFSDFVWVFDAATGHVSSASFSGLVDERIRVGPLRTSARVAIAVEVSTHVPGGYLAPRELAGRTVVGYCPDPTQAGCTAVASTVYDPESGWVRANGAVCAAWHSLRTLAYTSLGQAKFRELDLSPRRDAHFVSAELRHERRSTRSGGQARAC